MLDELATGAIDLAAGSADAATRRGCVFGLLINLGSAIVLLAGIALLIWGNVAGSVLIMVGGGVAIAAAVAGFIWSFIVRNS